MLFTKDIVDQINKAVYGNKSHMRSTHNHIVNNNLQQRIAEVILDTVAISVKEMIPLTSTTRKLASRVLKICKMPIDDLDDKQIIVIGASLIDYIAQAKLIKVEKQSVIGARTVRESWYLASRTEDFTNYANNIDTSKFEPDVISGKKIWKGTTMYFGSSYSVDIVRKARRYSVLNWYAPNKCPDFYKAVNRLNSQEFLINQDILKIIDGHPFTPKEITDKEKQKALKTINTLKRNALFVNELKFKEMHKWLEDNVSLDDEIIDRISQKKANEKSDDWLIEKSEEHLEVISSWSKRIDHDEIVRRANNIADNTINFTWNADTRGRLYTIQNYLQPLGSDLAKSLLIFKKPMQVSAFDFCIHLANCFGVDKESFEDRVAWVNDNSEDLLDIGQGLTTSKLFTKLSKEKKTKWQGLSACIEYVRLMDYMSRNGSDEGFITQIPVGLDATSSGVQIMSALGRDETVAEYVNISATKDGRVGDFYQYLGDFLSIDLYKGQGTYSNRLESLLSASKVGDKVWRKGAKRNAMTFAYSSTKVGMEIQQFEDRKDHGSEEYANLQMKDCRVIGSKMYEVCKVKIKRAYDLMQWMQDGINYVDDSAIVSWVLPDGFRAFQVKDRSKKMQVPVTIGNKKIKLVYYKWMNLPNKKAHKSAISPDVVHSLDAVLLRFIVNNLPTDSNIVTCHDQFSVDSYYVQELQEVAKDAYKLIADREFFKTMMANSFGVDRQLPQAGTWSVSELDNAEFIIC